MKKLKNNRFLNALLKKPVDKTPIWIMRQAGRYLPEYCAVRKKAGDFLTLCKTPELAAQVTLQPLERFDLDAAIIFSDILTIPDAMGLGLYFAEGEGPKFKHPLREEKDFKNIHLPDISTDLSYVTEAIKLTSKALDNKLPLIGFSGSPWTLACYMIEGSGSKTFHSARNLIYQQPNLLHHLLTLLKESIIDYLCAQITAGVDVIMLFDTWGGLLTPNHYIDFSLHYMKQILSGVKEKLPDSNIPSIIFTKQGGHWLEATADAGCNAIGLDWTININEARERVGKKVALQGNLDPALLFGTPRQIEAGVEKLLAEYGNGNGHIANLGHGIDKDTPPENVAILVNAVHEFSQPYHTSTS